MKHYTFTFFLLVFLFPICMVGQEFDSTFLQLDNATGQLSLTEKGANHFAELALNCIQVEYPNKLSHVMSDASQVKSPHELHPAFYGCFDWHSSVHGHWMLVRLLKLFPNMKKANEIRQKLHKNLSKSNLLQEAAYLHQANRKSFERMYGWAWLLKLAAELESWEDEQANVWAENMKPVTDAIVERYLNFLPKQDFPIRVGTHNNTAFGMSFANDYALQGDNEELSVLLAERCFDYYLTDSDCPGNWEPGGDDFLSPCLEEANLMSRFLSADKFEKWLTEFLPELKQGGPAQLMMPVEVSDRSDPKIVHLDGLNLSRAWCMYRIAEALPTGDKRSQVLREAANAHIMATLPYIASGSYEGEHWLASFAVYALSYAR